MWSIPRVIRKRCHYPTFLSYHHCLLLLLQLWPYQNHHPHSPSHPPNQTTPVMVPYGHQTKTRTMAAFLCPCMTMMTTWPTWRTNWTKPAYHLISNQPSSAIYKDCPKSLALPLNPSWFVPILSGSLIYPGNHPRPPPYPGPWLRYLRRNNNWTLITLGNTKRKQGHRRIV